MFQLLEDALHAYDTLPVEICDSEDASHHDHEDCLEYQQCSAEDEVIRTNPANQTETAALRVCYV